MAEPNSPHYIDLSMTPAVADALLRGKLPTLPQVTAVDDIKVGWNNRCFSLTTADQREYVLRLTKDSWPAAKIVAEAASLAALAHYKVDIPVPALVGYNADVDPVLRVRWMLMEKMPGTMLEAVWDTADNNERAAIAVQVHKIHTVLQSHRFDCIGGWVFDPADGTTPVLGPFFEGYGPFNSEREWLQYKFDSQVLKASSNPALESLREHIPAATAIVEAYLSTMSACPVVLFHGDFAFRNMLVKDGQIVGILDWEWCGTMPMWKEWGDVSFGDRHVYDYVPSFVYPNPSEFDTRQCLFEMIEAFSPWQMGCWPEKDAQYAAAANRTIQAALRRFSSHPSGANTSEAEPSAAANEARSS